MKSLTPKELYGLAGIEPTTTTAWGEKVTSKAPGVYVISVENVANIGFKYPFEEIEQVNWQADQEIVYVGRATALGTRLRQFYKHVYGQSSPHRGGQAILLLDAPKTITWAEISDFGEAEDRLIKAFQKHAGRLPFGNRMQSAKIKAPLNRFVAEKDEIKPMGKVIRTISLLTPEEKAANREHDRILGQNSN